MALQSSDQLRNLSIYSIYLRNHGNFNTFQLLKQDLGRIQSMGFDSIWLMPIHPIGAKNRKGSLGCPYSIQDYEKINPEYGGLEDFEELVKSAHDLGLKVLIDVVYNHTSHDSILWQTHPEYFLQNGQGQGVCKEPKWSDVIDLDYSNLDLWPILIESLKKWSSLGVDGFRCDVASLVPVAFWKKAREAVATINPATIWLAESVHTEFLQVMKSKGYEAADDAHLYEVFDILYDYDIHHQFEAFVKNKLSLHDFIEAIKNQDVVYPDHYIKLRFIENHDQPRFASLRGRVEDKVTFTVMSYLLKGATLFYAGQETSDTNTPSLFDVDPIHLEAVMPSYVELITKLNRLVKDEVFRTRDIQYDVLDDDLLVIRYDEDALVAVLNFGDLPKDISLQLLGSYEEILSGETLTGTPSLQVSTPLIYRKITT